MDKLTHLISYVQEQPWALHPRVLAQMVDILSYRAEGNRLTREEIQARIEANTGQVQELHAQQDRAKRNGGARGIAVIPIFGIIAQHAYMVDDISGPRGTSTERTSQYLREALESPDVDGIVLNVHSPGGSVYGVGELSAEIRAAKKQKPITAVANSEMASAAYHIGSSATDLSVTPNGRVGSVGVWSAHQDLSQALETEGIKVTLLSAGKYKVAGNPFEPLSEDARRLMQEEVNHYYELFVSAVAKGRNVAIDEVRNGFGEGAMVTAKQAVAEKMADRIETLENAIFRLGKETSPRRGANAADFSGEPEAAEVAMSERDEQDDTEEEIAARLRLHEITLDRQRERV